MIAQVLGAIVASGILFLIASGKAGIDVSAGFASNGYGAHSPGEYSLLAALITEVVMTMMFLLIFSARRISVPRKGLLRSPLAWGRP